MYKYNKEAKEKLLRDDIMAFLWAYFRISNSPQDVITAKIDEESSEQDGGRRKRDPKNANDD
jgi:hypothetical protein